MDCDEEASKLLEVLPTGDSDITVFIRLAATGQQAVFDLSGKFGATPVHAAQLMARLARNTVWRLGLSFHVGSQTTQPDAYLSTLRVAEQIAGSASRPIEFLDIGGGFPGDYINSKCVTGELLHAVLYEITCSENLSRMSLLCEVGRGLVYGGMSLFARVLSRRPDALYCGAGIFGGLLSAQQWLQFPVRVWRDNTPYQTEQKHTYRIFGPTCDSMDVLAFPYSLPADMREGDWLEFESTGAYSVSVRTPFNGFYANTVVGI